MDVIELIYELIEWCLLIVVVLKVDDFFDDIELLVFGIIIVGEYYFVGLCIGLIMFSCFICLIFFCIFFIRGSGICLGVVR